MNENPKNPLYETMNQLANDSASEEMEFFVSNHPELLKEDPIQFIGNHVSAYANKEDIAGSLRVVEHYKDAPYISMEVEEFLNDLKKELEKLGKNDAKPAPDKEKIASMLLSKEEDAIASALQYLSRQNIRLYTDLLRQFLSSDVAYKYKTLALFILIEQKVNEDFKVIRDGIIYTLNPNDLCLPFDDFGYLDCRNFIERKRAPQDVIDLAIEILNTSQIKIFPDGYVDQDNAEMMADIDIELAKEYLHEEADYSKISRTYGIAEEKVREIGAEIRKIIND